MLSTSPPAGPAEVAPTRTPRSPATTSLMNPSLPALCIQPRSSMLSIAGPLAEHIAASQTRQVPPAGGCTLTLATMTQVSRGPLGRITGLLQLPCDRRGVTSQDDDARDHDQQRSHLA